jgi:hypothetical protein
MALIIVGHARMKIVVNTMNIITDFDFRLLLEEKSRIRPATAERETSLEMNKVQNVL